MQRKVSEVPVLPLEAPSKFRVLRPSLLPATLPGQTVSPAVEEKGKERGQEAIRALGRPLPTQSTYLTQLKKLGSEKRGLAQGQPTRM